MREILETGRADPFEKEFLRKDGSRVPVRLTAAPLPGLPGRVVMGVEDLTARRAAEAALRESEARFRLVAESAPVMLWMSDRDGKCIYLNRALREFWGVAPEAIPEFDWGATLHPEDSAELFALVARAMQDRTGFAVEARYRRAADGAYRILRTEAQPRFGAGGEFLGMIGVNVDVTETRQAEAALRASEERLRMAQEAGGIGAWEFDRRTGRWHWSESNYRLWGIESGTPVTLDLILSLVHPEDRERARAAIADAAPVVGPIPELDFRILRRSDGAMRWILSRAEAIADERGRPVRTIGIMRDVTEQKASEERQALLMRELDHRAKNALAVVQAAVRLTPKDDPETFAHAVEGRVAALARAHTLLAEGRWQGAALRPLIEAELAAFLPGGNACAVDAAAAPPRVEVEGPDLALAPVAMQALSMALHELATNAVKYGALSAPGGRVRVAWWVDRAARLLRLRWEEAGGPPLAGPPARRGFGSRVVEATVRDQLGGQVERRWEPAGLVCEIAVPVERAVVGGIGPAQGAAAGAAAAD
ncbi:MAG: PAS domain S-box protein [Acetobacteraceae bacterium]|nr:PAS domain S-box protein [Acetobacteraceae bacterium]